MLKVTVEDEQTGEVRTRKVPAGDYIIITHDPAYLERTDVRNDGTHVLTVKRKHYAPEPDNG